MARLEFRFGPDRTAYVRGAREGEQTQLLRFQQERGLTEPDLQAIQRAYNLFGDAQEEQTPHTVQVPDKAGTEQRITLDSLVRPGGKYLSPDKFVRLYAYGSNYPEEQHAQPPTDWPAHLNNFHPDDIGRALLPLGYSQ